MRDITEITQEVLCAISMNASDGCGLQARFMTSFSVCVRRAPLPCMPTQGPEVKMGVSKHIKYII